MAVRTISLRGVSVHNLKEVDLDIPHRQLVVICGVSGSGKTSLALDTLYAEGQRRYIESFSAYTRQFLQRLDKPSADRIDGIPPSIAVTHKSPSRSSRSTVGTATETHEYLRLLFARIGKIICDACDQPVEQDSPDRAAQWLGRLPAGSRFMIAFHPQIDPDEEPAAVVQDLLGDGFVRAIHQGGAISLDAFPDGEGVDDLQVIVDRLTPQSSVDRIRDSLETAMRAGDGRGTLFLQLPEEVPASERGDQGTTCTIDGRTWTRVTLSDELCCRRCGRNFTQPQPQLFSFNSPLGACPRCEGFGNLIEPDWDLIVPDPTKSIRDGAIAPWNSPAYRHELEELLDLAEDYELPVDVPFSQLTESHVRLIRHGVPERNFGGLDGFFAWLERRKYKMHLRVFLSRWRSARPCPDCQGDRLRPESLAVYIGGRNVADIAKMKVRDSWQFFQQLALSDQDQQIGRTMLEQVRARLKYLNDVGLGYLTLGRPLKTLSGGEMQRVLLTSALGSSLVNMLYVLDEPSIGLHPQDTERLLRAVERLRDRGNSVVVVEHEEEFLRRADSVVEVGPGAGESGGQIVFQGTPEEMLLPNRSVTGDFLTGRRGLLSQSDRRTAKRGWIKLVGARGNNLKNVTAEFPLGTLCLVTGVSGAGKSSLVQDTLYPALCRRKRKDAPKPLPFDDVLGDGQIDDVTLVDQSPVGKSPRSNPVTYIKAFDAIRAVFAETIEARTHNYTASHFSFNVDGGRCSACQGDGFVQIDMQFLADVYMKCGQCQGRRYRKEILEVTYRGKSIADVLEMSVRKAFSFFRGQPKVQKRLKRLMDVGLDYVRLGQPANTLSAGEAQRLKLAGYLATAKRNRTLFLLDEPTTGLHFSDIVKLLDCFEALLNDGHSLIVVEHNLQLMRAADYIVDIGPGAADEGGRIVAAGTPEQIAAHRDSVTGSHLASSLSDLRQPSTTPQWTGESSP